MANMKQPTTVYCTATPRFLVPRGNRPSWPSGVLWTLILPPDQRPFSFSAALKAAVEKPAEGS